MKEAQVHTLRLLKPGASCAEVAAKHDDYMRARGLPAELRLYAHGQGYDLVERPLIRADETMVLEEHMNLAVHPGYETAVDLRRDLRQLFHRGRRPRCVPAQDPEADIRGLIARMKIDVLSIGAFPEATNAELANRFAVTRHFNRPAPDALSAELKARIRGIATEANRGADRALIAALPKLEVISVFGVGTNSVDLAAARERSIPVSNTPDIIADEVGRSRHRPDAGVGAADPACRPLRARRQLGKQGTDPARPQRQRQDHGRGRPRRHRPRHRRSRRGLPHAGDLSTARAARPTRPTSSSPIWSSWRGRATI